MMGLVKGDRMNKDMYEQYRKGPKSERKCNCGEIVNASQFARMANGYQAWGWCPCGCAHAFGEWIRR